MHNNIISYSASASVSATLVLALLISLFAFSEPTIGQAQESTDILITQTITGETSFTTNPGNVDLSDIASISGGTSNGTTTFVVQSNAAAGYNVTIAFDQDAAMQRDGGGGNIPDYVPAAAEADFNFVTTGTAGRFAYSVVGDTVGIVDPSFQDDGSDCGSDGAGGANAYDQCWAEPTTGAETILNANAATAGAGATSSVRFRVFVPANPSPAIPAGEYTATATLTVSEN